MGGNLPLTATPLSTCMSLSLPTSLTTSSSNSSCSTPAISHVSSSLLLQWRIIPTATMPYDVHETSSVRVAATMTHNEWIVLIGGSQTDSRTSVGRIQIYDCVTRTWLHDPMTKPITDLPFQVQKPYVACVAQMIYVWCPPASSDVSASVMFDITQPHEGWRPIKVHEQHTHIDDTHIHSSLSNSRHVHYNTIDHLHVFFVCRIFLQQIGDAQTAQCRHTSVSRYGTHHWWIHIAT